MEIEKIEIVSENKKDITDIGMLVDQKSFLIDVQKLRKKWNITSLYKPQQLDKFLNWHIAGDMDTIITKSQAMQRLEMFNNDITELRNKYNRTKNFDLVITYAAGFGVVPDYVYKSCYWDKIILSPKDGVDDPKNYQYVIVLTPRTEKKELDKVYKEFQQYISNKIEFHGLKLSCDSTTEEYIKEHVFGATFNSANLGKYKTLKQPARTREWYWMRYKESYNDKNIKPKKYSQILDEWNNRCPQKGNHFTDEQNKKCPYCSIIDLNIIERSIFEYKKLLRSS